MIVWVVETGEYSQRFILGVFDDPYTAKELIDSKPCNHLGYQHANWPRFSHRHGWYMRRNENGVEFSSDCRGGIDITPYRLNYLP